ncbi:hypothetical protein Tco_0870600 [Tanacetum coccineum]
MVSVSNQSDEPEIEPVTEPEIEPGTGEGDGDSPKGVRSSDRIKKRPNTYTRFVYQKRSSNANANKTKPRTSAASIAKKIQNNGLVCDGIELNSMGIRNRAKLGIDFELDEVKLSLYGLSLREH